MKKYWSRSMGSILLILALLMAGNGPAVSAETETETVKLEDGRRMAEIYVVSITGNELTYYEISEEDEEETEEAAEDETEETEGGMPDFSSGEMPDFSSGEMPDFSGSGMPEGMPDFSSGEMPDFSGGGIPENMTDFSGGQDVETKTVYLPVSAVVHTDTGEARTFTILEAGDELEVLIGEKDSGEEMIIEIWMLGADGGEG